MARCAAALCLAALLLCSGAMAVAAEAAAQAGDTPGGSGGEAAAAAEAGTPAAAATQVRERPPFIVLRPQDSWLLEIVALSFLLAFLVNLVIGRRRNERLALAWTAEVRSWYDAGGACLQSTSATTAPCMLESRIAGRHLCDPQSAGVRGLPPSLQTNAAGGA